MPSGEVAWIIVVAVVGGVLAAAVNNLPAAAFGAVWLAAARPVTLVAFLVGTKILAIATPHGSLATMLSHAVADRRGRPVDRRRYLRRPWRDALLVGAAALLAVVWLR